MLRQIATLCQIPTQPSGAQSPLTPPAMCEAAKDFFAHGAVPNLLLDSKTIDSLAQQLSRSLANCTLTGLPSNMRAYLRLFNMSSKEARLMVETSGICKQQRPGLVKMRAVAEKTRALAACKRAAGGKEVRTVCNPNPALLHFYFNFNFNIKNCNFLY
jgi:hypothetical protein